MPSVPVSSNIASDLASPGTSTTPSSTPGAPLPASGTPAYGSSQEANLLNGGSGYGAFQTTTYTSSPSQTTSPSTSASSSAALPSSQTSSQLTGASSPAALSSQTTSQLTGASSSPSLSQTISQSTSASFLPAALSSSQTPSQPTGASSPSSLSQTTSQSTGGPPPADLSPSQSTSQSTSALPAYQSTGVLPEDLLPSQATSQSTGVLPAGLLPSQATSQSTGVLPAGLLPSQASSQLTGILPTDLLPSQASSQSTGILPTDLLPSQATSQSTGALSAGLPYIQTSAAPSLTPSLSVPSLAASLSGELPLQSSSLAGGITFGPGGILPVLTSSDITGTPTAAASSYTSLGSPSSPTYLPYIPGSDVLPTPALSSYTSLVPSSLPSNLPFIPGSDVLSAAASSSYISLGSPSPTTNLPSIPGSDVLPTAVPTSYTSLGSSPSATNLPYIPGSNVPPAAASSSYISPTPPNVPSSSANLPYVPGTGMPTIAAASSYISPTAPNVPSSLPTSLQNILSAAINGPVTGSGNSLALSPTPAVPSSSGVLNTDSLPVIVPPTSTPGSPSNTIPTPGYTQSSQVTTPTGTYPTNAFSGPPTGSSIPTPSRPTISSPPSFPLTSPSTVSSAVPGIGGSNHTTPEVPLPISTPSGDYKPVGPSPSVDSGNSILPTSTDGVPSQNWLPKTIMIEPSPTASGAPYPTGISPSQLPQMIQPQNIPPPTAPNDCVVQIGFLYGLNYAYVVSNSIVAAQMFQLLPQCLANALNIDASEIQVHSLVPYNTQSTLGYITTLAQVAIPDYVKANLQQEIHAPLSALYTQPTDLLRNLTAQINPAIPIEPGTNVGLDSPTGTAGGSTPSSSSGNGDGGIFTPNSQESSPSTKGTTIGIACASVVGASAYGAAMFFVARRYKRHKSGHRRVSSVASPEMTYSGSPFVGGALMAGGRGTPGTGNGRDSRGSGPSAGNSARTAFISAPMMAENSLGWN